MQAKQYSKNKVKIIVRVVVVKILFLIFLAACYGFYHQYDKLSNQLLASQYAILKLNQALVDITETKNKLSYLEKISATEKMSDAIEIEKSIEFLTRLKEAYKVDNLDFIILSPQSKTDVKINDKTIEIAQILVKFNSSEDETAYKFLDSLTKGFPGFIKVTHFHVTRHESNEDIIDSENITELKKLVSTKIIFNWHTR